MAGSGGAGSRRHEVYYKFIVDLESGKGGKSNLKAQEQAFKNKINSTVGGLGAGFEDVTAQWNKKLPDAAGRTGKKMYNAMMAPFASGFIQKGFGINAEMDDYILKQTQLRGITTGLRHEVGKLRNTLLLFAFATAGVVTEFKSWFQAALKNEAALVGLRAVAVSTGLSFQKLSEFSQDLEAKGFLSIGGSSAALKNLAASNLTLGETTKVLSALTDAAAFNRQGTLGMEEAIVGATQGIKNQNSIMIDNAGITKNVSIMYREYAAIVGKTSGSLTEMEKKQAIVNGIIGEAALFAGNAEKSLTTYQGKMTKFQTDVLKTQRSLGNLIAPGIVDGLESVSAIFSEVGTNELFSKTVKSIADSFSLLVKSVGYFIQALEKGFNFFNSFGGSLSMLLDSPILKFGIMLTLLKKVGDYATGLADRLRAAAFAKTFQGIEEGMLRSSVISKMNLAVPLSTLKKAELSGKMIGTAISNKVSQVVGANKVPLQNVPGEKLMKNAQNESIIQAAVLIHMKSRTAEALVEEQVQKRLNSLGAQQNIIAQGGVQEALRKNALLQNQAAQQAELNRIEQARSSMITRVVPDKSGANQMRAYKHNQQQLNIVAEAQRTINNLKREHDILEMQGAGPEMTRQRDLLLNKQAYIALLKEQYMLEQKANAFVVSKVYKFEKAQNRLRAPVVPAEEVQFSTRTQRSKDMVGQYSRRIDIEENINRIIAQRARLESMGVQKGMALKTNSSERVLIEKEILQSKALQLEKELLINNARMMGYNILERTKAKLGKDGKVVSPVGELTMVKDISKEKGLKTGEQKIMTDNKGRMMIASMNEVARANSGMLGKMIIDWKLVGQVIKTASIEAKLFFANLKLGTVTSVFSVKTLGMAFQSVKAAILTTGAAFMTAFSTIMIWVTMIQVAVSLLSDLFKDNTKEIREQTKLVDIETKALSELYLKNSQVQASIKATSETFKDLTKVAENTDFDLIMSPKGNTSKMLQKDLNNIINQLKEYDTKIQLYKKRINKVPLTLDEQNLMAKNSIPRGLDEEWYTEQQKSIDELKTSYSSFYNELTTLQDKYAESVEYTIDKLGDFYSKGGGVFGSLVAQSKNYLQFLREIENNRQNLLAINIPVGDIKTFQEEEIKQIKAYDLLKRAAYESYYRETRKIIDTQEKALLDLRNKYIDLQMSNVSDSLEKRLELIKNNLQKERNVIQEEMRKIQSEITTANRQFDIQQVELKLIDLNAENATRELQIGLSTIWGKLKQANFKAADKFKKELVTVIDPFTGLDKQVSKTVKVELKDAPKFKAAVDLVNNSLKEMYEHSITKVLPAVNEIFKTFEETGKVQAAPELFDSLDKSVSVLIGLQQKLALIPFDALEPAYAEDIDNLKTYIDTYLNTYQLFSKNLSNLSSQGKNVATSEMLRGYNKQSLDEFKSGADKILAANEKLLGGIEQQGEIAFNKAISDFKDVTLEESKQAAALQNLKRAYSVMAPEILGFLEDYTNLQRELDYSSVLDKKFTEEYLAAKKLGGASVQELEKLQSQIDIFNAKRQEKLDFQKEEFLVGKYGELVKSISAGSYELELFNRALNGVTHPEAIDYFSELDKSINLITGSLHQWNMEAGQRFVKVEDFFTPSLNLFKSKTGEFKKELMRLQADRSNRQSVSIFGAMLGLDETALSEIDGKYNGLLAAHKKNMDRIQGLLRTQIASIEMIPLEDRTTNQKNSLKALNNQLGETINIMTLFDSTLNDMKLEDKLKIWQDATKQVVAGLVELGTQIGVAIGNNKAATDEVYKNQQKSTQEIDQLYRNGEITQGERLHRIAEMNKYYASQISSTWQTITLSVTKNILDMTQNVISAMAQAAAAKAMGDSFFATLGSGLLSALPFVGAAVAVGALASAFATPEPEMDMPEFETPQNQMSKFGGTIKAEDVVITIQPTFFIEGQQVFIGSGSVVEFVDEATELMKTGIQQAIDNKEFTFDSVRSLG